MNTKELEFHPAAAIFPLIEGEAFKELVESIQRNGQREDIVLMGGRIIDGRNRYRACQELKIKPRTREFDPVKEGKSILQFILDGNLHRRHLTTSQRAVIASEGMKAMNAEAEAYREKAKTAKPIAEWTDPEMGTDNEPAVEVVPESHKAPAKKNGKAKAIENPVLPPDPGPPPVVPTTEQMAVSAGVSTDTLKKAEKLLEDDPEEAAQVAAGKKSLNKATADVKEKKAKEAQKADRKETLKRLTKVCGKDFATAFDQNTILKTATEASAFIALDDDLMGQVAPLIVTGWKVAKAVSLVKKETTPDTKVSDLINRAISGGGFFSVVVNGYEITAASIANGNGHGKE